MRGAVAFMLFRLVVISVCTRWMEEVVKEMEWSGPQWILRGAVGDGGRSSCSIVST